MRERAVRVIISGRVQGVGFRAFLTREVARRSVAGWVRNRHNGTVEAVLTGPAEQVDELLVLCREGPGPADVAEVLVSDYAGPELRRFTQLPTE